MEDFYKYLYGHDFLLKTDHAVLKWLMQFRNPEGQITKWIERLQEYDRLNTEPEEVTIMLMPCPERPAQMTAHTALGQKQ